VGEVNGRRVVLAEAAVGSGARQRLRRGLRGRFWRRL